MTTPTFAAWARLGGSDGADAQPETIVVTTASNSKLSRKLLAGLAAGLLLASAMTISAWRLLREEKRLPAER